MFVYCCGNESDPAPCDFFDKFIRFTKYQYQNKLLTVFLFVCTFVCANLRNGLTDLNFVFTIGSVSFSSIFPMSRQRPVTMYSIFVNVCDDLLEDIIQQLYPSLRSSNYEIATEVVSNDIPAYHHHIINAANTLICLSLVKQLVGLKTFEGFLHPAGNFLLMMTMMMLLLMTMPKPSFPTRTFLLCPNLCVTLQLKMYLPRIM